MRLALFDLDNTLLDGDSDHLWGEFLISQGAVDGEGHREENDRFLREYREGRLDIDEFLRFALRPLAEHPAERLHAWRETFLETAIMPRIPTESLQLVDWHRAQGELPVIITATNRFVTEPIAALMGVDHLLATEPEMGPEGFTGNVTGTPCFREGKLIRLREWLGGDAAKLSEASFYSDSANDLPLLKAVGRPVAVNPDPELHRVARAHSWPILELRATQVSAGE